MISASNLELLKLTLNSTKQGWNITGAFYTGAAELQLDTIFQYVIDYLCALGAAAALPNVTSASTDEVVSGVSQV